MSTMTLFHTSPVAISAITRTGRFDEFLFFSSKVYVMTADKFVVHEIELDNDDIIEAGALFFREDSPIKLQPLVDQFCTRFNVDANTAEEIISEREQLVSSDADELWDVQLYTARAAKLLGFRAVKVSDEQGAAYMIDMLGHHAELRIVR